LDETIWSLTLPRVKRISGSKNFRSPPQKDFCNNIGTKPTCRPYSAMSGFRVQSGKHVLALSFSGFDPGCVKTCTSQECAELFSLSSSLSSGRKHFWFSNLRNRDGISTRRLNVGVFTQPRPKGDVPSGVSAIAAAAHAGNLDRHLAFVPARLIFGKSYKSILLSEAMGPL
jgi:hypothetical protein